MARHAAGRDTVFQALLRIFPSEFRVLFGREMAADFQDQHEDAARGGRAGVVGLWIRTLMGVVRTAPAEHLDVLKRDVVHAMRVFRKRPASTITVVLSLAIGIGLNTALFAVVNGVLWRQLPFHESERLVRVVQYDPKAPQRTDYLAPSDFVDIRESSHEFLALGAGGYTSQTIVEPGEPEQLSGMTVTEGYFETLGVRPVIGRTFTTSDFAEAGSLEFNQPSWSADGPDRRTTGEPAGFSAIVISQAMWQRRFLGRPDIIGQRMRLASGTRAEIVGVVGAGMTALAPPFGPAPEWWMPRSPRREQRATRFLDVVGRMAPGRTLTTAQAELDVIARNVPAPALANSGSRAFRAVSLLETVVTNVRGQLTFLFGAVFCVLLVTCVNVVHLFLANAANRRVEFATRAALGATRGSLVRQTLTESGLLAVAGGAGGVMLAIWGLPVLLLIAPAALPRLDEIHIEWPAVAFAGVVAMGAALVCGGAASLPITLTKPWHVLSHARSGDSLQGRRARRILIVAEMAVVLMLVVASMLMVRTLRSLVNQDLGFDPKGVVAATLPRPMNAGRDAAALSRIHQVEVEVIEAVRQIPGVVAAGVGGSPMGLSLGVGGVRVPGDAREFPIASLTPISVGYFEALGARLTAGRFFSPDDRQGAPAVAIVSEHTAQEFWPSQDAIGRTLILGRNGQVAIVGIVADMTEFGLETKGGGIYLPHLQSSFVTPGTMLIRTDRDPVSLVPAIKTIVRQINPEQPFPGVTPLQEEIDRATAPRRFILRLVGLFAVLGVTIAAIGIYGVLAESVAARVTEIGLRMALGGQRRDIIIMILRQGAWMIAGGLVIGVAGAVLLRQQMASLVFGVQTLDPVSFAAACAILAITGLTACAIPAFRAARFDPAIALRDN